MKAVVFRPSRGLVYEEVPDDPVAADEVLVKVANTGFCGSDHSLLAGGLLPDVYRERIASGLAVKVLLQIGDEF